MLARCTACRHTFRTEEFGRQRCPVCGAEVHVAEPVATAYAAPAADLAASDPPAGSGDGEPLAWERRAELGFWTALGRTLKEALASPTKFYGRMRFDSAAGAHLFFFVVAVAPQLFGDVVNRLVSGSSSSQVDEVMQLVQSSGGALPIDPRLVHAVEAYEKASNSTAAFVGTLVWDVVGAYLMLFALAGIAHVVLRMFGQARGGWTATFKTFAYSFAPCVVQAIPFLCCTGLVALLWASALQIVGLKRAHDTTSGYALLAVIGWEVPFLVLFIVGATAGTLYLARHVAL